MRFATIRSILSGTWKGSSARWGVALLACGVAWASATTVAQPDADVAPAPGARQATQGRYPKNWTCLPILAWLFTTDMLDDEAHAALLNAKPPEEWDTEEAPGKSGFPNVALLGCPMDVNLPCDWGDIVTAAGCDDPLGDCEMVFAYAWVNVRAEENWQLTMWVQSKAAAVVYRLLPNGQVHPKTISGGASEAAQTVTRPIVGGGNNVILVRLKLDPRNQANLCLVVSDKVMIDPASMVFTGEFSDVTTLVASHRSAVASWAALKPRAR